MFTSLSLMLARLKFLSHLYFIGEPLLLVGSLIGATRFLVGYRTISHWITKLRMQLYFLVQDCPFTIVYVLWICSKKSWKLFFVQIVLFKKAVVIVLPSLFLFSLAPKIKMGLSISSLFNRLFTKTSMRILMGKSNNYQ